MGESGLGKRTAAYFRVAPVTLTIATVCVIAWLVTAAQSLSFVNSYYDSSLASSWTLWGPGVAQGEFYRVFSSMFMHLDAGHVAVNVILLLFIGSEVERHLGSALYLVCYLTGGLGAAAAVLLMDFDVPTVGASGAAYALMVLLISGYRERRQNLVAIMTLILCNVVFTFVTPQVSLWGHLGGLLTGVVLLGAVSVESKVARWVLVSAVLAVVGLLITLGAGVWG